MARPRRSTEQEWIDIFCDWDFAEQERTLKYLGELHRTLKRQASKRFAEPAKASEQPMLDGVDNGK